MIKQVTNEWVSTYTQGHLKSFEEKGEGLEEHRHWCSWLKANLPERFQVHLLENRRLPTSVGALKEWWEPWIEDEDTMYALVAEWREQYQWEKYA